MSKIEKKVDLFLDSGAFSAWTRGITINLQEYIDFIKTNNEYLEHYAVLDVIGDPEATYRNQKEMESQGLKPIPCFHYGEDFKWLEFYINNYKYIALGGLVGRPKAELTEHLDKSWEIICNTPKSIPKCKIHGFGITSIQFLLRYPWYSVDSTSWVLVGRTGGIYVPKRKNNNWDYLQKPIVVSVSNKSPDKKIINKHYQTMTPEDKALVDLYLKEKGYEIGMSSFVIKNKDYTLLENEKWAEKAKGNQRLVERIMIKGVSNDYILRDEINIMYYLDLQNALPEWPWAFKKIRKGFFN